MEGGLAGDVQMMRVVFRCDASKEIGTGHIMRCITLANKLKSNGDNILFVSRQLPNTMADLIMESGFELERLEYLYSDECDELQHASWLKSSQSDDAKATIKVIEKMEVDWVVVDHYALDCRWQKEIRPYTKKIMVIDDIADRKHDCDVLLDQNYYTDRQDRYKNYVSEGCKLLLGPKYALLREDFIAMRKRALIKNGSVKKVLVNFGGVDLQNYTEKTIIALSKITGFKFDVDVVIGDQHPQMVQIHKLCKKFDYLCHVQTKQMAQLMINSDLAIGAGGSTSWERCIVGLPSIVIPVADNQKNLVKHAAKAGVLYYPEINSDFIKELKFHVKALIGNSSLRENISEAAMLMVDGGGVVRATKEIERSSMISSISIRLATEADAKITWPWRNNLVVRQCSFSSAEVSLNTHIDWWHKSLLTQERVLLIGTVDGKEFGVLRYDIYESVKAMVSIYIAPEMIGYGLGKKFLQLGESWVKKNVPSISVLVAKIFIDNKVSLKVFLDCGYEKHHYELTREIKL